MSEKYEFIAREERIDGPSMRKMCRWLGVSKSGYCEWKKRRPSKRALWRAQMTRIIRGIFEDSDGTYGYRRIHAIMARSGVQIAKDTVRGLMRAEGLYPCQPAPWRPVTTIRGGQSDIPDRCHRDFTARAPGAKLVSDITYIPTWEGFVYLATVLDCYSKKVIGYALKSHMRAEIVTEAMAMAARNARLVAGETIFHSDRGSQYRSQEMTQTAQRFGLLQSMGRTGVCWDNAWAESFNGTLKNERCNRTVYATKQQAIEDVTRWIELFYNQKRIHSAIGYQTPNECEQAYWDDLAQKS